MNYHTRIFNIYWQLTAELPNPGLVRSGDETRPNVTTASAPLHRQVTQGSSFQW